MMNKDNQMASPGPSIDQRMEMFNLLASQESDDEQQCKGDNDHEDKKINNNIPDIAGKVLKVCNVIREKNYGSKILYKQSGIICGARDGTKSVNEPVMIRTKSLSTRNSNKFMSSTIDAKSNPKVHSTVRMMTIAHPSPM